MSRIPRWQRNKQSIWDSFLDPSEIAWPYYLGPLTAEIMAVRTSFSTAMLEHGVISVDEMRELEDSNPIGPDDDQDNEFFD